MQNEGLLDVLYSAVTLDQRWKGYQIWLSAASLWVILSFSLFFCLISLALALVLHILKDFSGLGHISASDTTINDWIVGNDIWDTLLGLLQIILLYHDVVNFQCLVEFVRPRICFYHSSVNHGIRLDSNSFIIISQNFLEDLLSFPNVTILDTGIDQATKRDIIIQIWTITRATRVFGLALWEHLESLVESAKLAVDLDEYAHLYGLVLILFGNFIPLIGFFWYLFQFGIHGLLVFGIFMC